MKGEEKRTRVTIPMLRCYPNITYGLGLLKSHVSAMCFCTFRETQTQATEKNFGPILYVGRQTITPLYLARPCVMSTSSLRLQPRIGRRIWFLQLPVGGQVSFSPQPPLDSLYTRADQRVLFPRFYIWNPCKSRGMRWEHEIFSDISIQFQV